MYFWKINKLKEQLRTGTLSQSEIFKYLMAYIVLNLLFHVAPNASNNQWDTLEKILVFFITIIGTYFLYLSNNGSSGKNFLERYISLYLVFGIRFTVYFIIIGIPLCFFLNFYGFINLDNTNLVDVMVVTIAEIIFYWRLSFHFKGVANISTI
ncbi:MAG: hypothetical protein KAI43_10575 [Candidatus Aureabacteria bacterium]|nr:hypothetical protein [Candidatus Auribacterota bacterium]